MRFQPIYVSFYTPDYREEAAALEDTLMACGVEYDIRERAPGRNWLANVGQKPAFLLEMHSLYCYRPLVWLDADARMRRVPDWDWLVDTDIAATVWHRPWNGQAELLSGTLWINKTANANAVLRAWARRIEQPPPGVRDENDQDALFHTITAINKNTPQARLRFMPLPADYTWFDLLESPAEPIIEHTQASRRLRKD